MDLEKDVQDVGLGGPKAPFIPRQGWERADTTATGGGYTSNLPGYSPLTSNQAQPTGGDRLGTHQAETGALMPQLHLCATHTSAAPLHHTHTPFAAPCRRGTVG
jgi:hypothetical protein